MFVTLLILLFVAQPAKGPSADSNHNRRENGTHQQIETEQKKDSSRESPSHSTPVIIEQHYSTTNGQRPTDDDGDYWNKIIAGATVVLAIFTIIIAIYGIRQYKALRETSEKQLRAYVYCTCAQGLPIEHNTLAFAIRNSGQTPARHVTAFVQPDFREFSLEGTLTPRRNPNGPPPSRASLHKNGVDMEITAIIPFPSDKEGWEALYARTKVMYFWGRIEYEDVFGRSHYTNFRFHSSYVNVTEGERRTVMIVNSSDGNDED